MAPGPEVWAPQLSERLMSVALVLLGLAALALNLAHIAYVATRP
jgi:hypothetical protein